MSSRASRGEDPLDGIDLAAVQLNLHALGHDVDESQLVGMLKGIDIGQLLSRASSRPRTAASPHSHRSAASTQQKPVSIHRISAKKRVDESHHSYRTEDDASDMCSATCHSRSSQKSDSPACSASQRHSGGHSSVSGSQLSSLSDQASWNLIVQQPWSHSIMPFRQQLGAWPVQVSASDKERRQRSSLSSASRHVIPLCTLHQSPH